MFVLGRLRVGLDGRDVIGGGTAYKVGSGAGRSVADWLVEGISAQERSAERESAEGRSAAKGHGWERFSEWNSAGSATACSTMGRLGRAAAEAVGTLDQCSRAG